jgi:hypothetical protein
VPETADQAVPRAERPSAIPPISESAGGRINLVASTVTKPPEGGNDLLGDELIAPLRSQPPVMGVAAALREADRRARFGDLPFDRSRIASRFSSAPPPDRVSARNTGVGGPLVGSSLAATVEGKVARGPRQGSRPPRADAARRRIRPVGEARSRPLMMDDTYSRNRSPHLPAEQDCTGHGTSAGRIVENSVRSGPPRARTGPRLSSYGSSPRAHAWVYAEGHVEPRSTDARHGERISRRPGRRTP